ncbi:MAG: hypothetical protein IT358_09140, partial [Gemmatimonadaceae bacterium]|nr:hypothetical protein [Gemmatimonadaceae bacterium]
MISLAPFALALLAAAAPVDSTASARTLARLVAEHERRMVEEDPMLRARSGLRV